jgi:hypothetical protein
MTTSLNIKIQFKTCGHEFLHMMGALTIFGKNSFIFSFVGYGLVTKSLRVGCTFEMVVEKTKC